MNTRGNWIRNIAVAGLLVMAMFAMAPAVEAAPVGTSESWTLYWTNTWLGTPYVYGGNSHNGIDCSHLVYQVYRQAGAYYPSYLNVAAIKRSPYYVRTNSPTIGDIVLWEKDYGGYDFSGHVGIYIGNGQFIHASGSAGKVVADSFYNSRYYPGNVIMQAQPYFAKWMLGSI